MLWSEEIFYEKTITRLRKNFEGMDLGTEHKEKKNFQLKK